MMAKITVCDSCGRTIKIYQPKYIMQAFKGHTTSMLNDTKLIIDLCICEKCMTKKFKYYFKNRRV